MLPRCQGRGSGTVTWSAWCAYNSYCVYVAWPSVAWLALALAVARILLHVAAVVAPATCQLSDASEEPRRQQPGRQAGCLPARHPKQPKRKTWAPAKSKSNSINKTSPCEYIDMTERDSVCVCGCVSVCVRGGRWVDGVPCHKVEMRLNFKLCPQEMRYKLLALYHFLLANFPSWLFTALSRVQ